MKTKSISRCCVHSLESGRGMVIIGDLTIAASSRRWQFFFRVWRFVNMRKWNELLVTVQWVVGVKSGNTQEEVASLLLRHPVLRSVNNSRVKVNRQKKCLLQSTVARKGKYKYSSRSYNLYCFRCLLISLLL